MYAALIHNTKMTVSLWGVSGNVQDYYFQSFVFNDGDSFDDKPKFAVVFF